MKALFSAIIIFLGTMQAFAGQPSPVTLQIDRTVNPSPLCVYRLSSSPICQGIGTISATNVWTPLGPAGLPFAPSATIDTTNANNITGGTLNVSILPALSAYLDTISATQGAMLYRGSAGWNSLGPCQNGYVIASGGPGANPTCVPQTTGGGGSVTAVSAGTGLTGGTITTSGSLSLANPTTSVIGGVLSATGPTNQSMIGISTSGVPLFAQITTLNQSPAIASNGYDIATTAWVNNHYPVIEVKGFAGSTNATCNTATNDDVVINAAITQANSNGGGIVELPASGCKVSATVHVQRGVWLRGQGFNVGLTPSASISAIVQIDEGLSKISGLQIANASGYASIGVYVNKPFTGFPFVLEDSSILGFSAGGVYIVNGDNITINRNYFLNNSPAISSQNFGINARYTNNLVQGGPGFYFNMSTQGPEGVIIDGNDFVLGAAGDCINIQAALDFQIINNTCDQITNGNGVTLTGNHTIANVASINNWYGSSASNSSVQYGVLAYASNYGINGLHSDHDRFYGFKQAAIYSLGSTSAHNSDFQIDHPFFYYPGSGTLQNARDIQVDYTDACVINNAKFTGSASFVADTGANCSVDRAYWNTPPVGAGVATTKFGRQQSGSAFVLQNSGNVSISASVPAASYLYHNLSVTPQPSDIIVTPTNNPSNLGFFWVDTCVGPTGSPASSCVLHYSVNPGSPATFGFKADVTQ